MQEQVEQVEAQGVIAMQLVIRPKGKVGERADPIKAQVERTARGSVRRITEDGIVVKVPGTGNRRGEGECRRQNQQEGGSECDVS